MYRGSITYCIKTELMEMDQDRMDISHSDTDVNDIPVDSDNLPVVPACERRNCYMLPIIGNNNSHWNMYTNKPSITQDKSVIESLQKLEDHVAAGNKLLYPIENANKVLHVLYHNLNVIKNRCPSKKRICVNSASLSSLLMHVEPDIYRENVVYCRNAITDPHYITSFPCGRFSPTIVCKNRMEDGLRKYWLTIRVKDFNLPVETVVGMGFICLETMKTYLTSIVCAKELDLFDFQKSDYISQFNSFPDDESKKSMTIKINGICLKMSTERNITDFVGYTGIIKCSDKEFLIGLKAIEMHNRTRRLTGDITAIGTSFRTYINVVYSQIFWFTLDTLYPDEFGTKYSIFEKVMSSSSVPQNQEEMITTILCLRELSTVSHAFNQPSEIIFKLCRYINVMDFSKRNEINPESMIESNSTVDNETEKSPTVNEGSLRGYVNQVVSECHDNMASTTTSSSDVETTNTDYPDNTNDTISVTATDMVGLYDALSPDA
jgi:hypothetical protein